jgi:predicted nucleic acid-binding Zn ribbon protein
VNCPQCGAQVGATDDFCGNCGNYLGWGAKAARDNEVHGPRNDAGGRVDGPGGGGVAGEFGERRGGGAGPASPGEADAASAARRAAEAALIVPIEVQPPADPATPGGLAPAASSGPAGPGKFLAPADAADLGPVLPGRPEARRPLPTAAAGVTVIGPPCPVCGTPNPPDRRFCRHCATPLHPEQHAASATRRRRWRWRGDRSRWLRRLAALAVVAAVVVAGVIFWPQLTGLWEDLRDRLSTTTAVSPASTSATAEIPGHPASAAVDGLSNRYWGAPAVGDSIEFTFAAPFRLLSVVVHAGASAEEAGFATEARPTALDMVVTTEDGASRTVPVTLADQPGSQRTDTGISDVTRIRLVIRGAAGLAPGRHIALGEVEFFRRS